MKNIQKKYKKYISKRKIYIKKEKGKKDNAAYVIIMITL